MFLEKPNRRGRINESSQSIQYTIALPQLYQAYKGQLKALPVVVIDLSTLFKKGA